MVYGQKVPRHTPRRLGVIAEPESSGGNIVLRVGRENHLGDAGGWHQTEHVVLTRVEAREFVAAIEHELLDDVVRRRHPGESRDDHIARIVEQFAGPAFWREVGRAYPQVKTGDFGPEESHAIATAMERAVQTWLLWNEPAPTSDQLAKAAELLADMATGMQGITRTVEIRLVGDQGVPDPAEGERQGQVNPNDLVVISTAVSREDPDEATFVAIISPECDVTASYEVQ